MHGWGIHPRRGGRRGGFIIVMTRPALAGAPAHPKDEPFVEPQTYSLVKEQLTYLFTTPVVTGGSVDKSSRRTRASQPSITAADLSRFDANVATTKKRQAENVTGSASDLFFQGSLGDAAGRERLVWDQTRVSSCGFRVLPARPGDTSVVSSRDAGVYGSFSTRQDRLHDFFVSRLASQARH